MLRFYPRHLDIGLPNWWPSATGWGAFLTSPGFAGVMAVVAASVAGFFVSRQLSQARRQHADERWWESLKWTYEVISGKGGSASVGPDVSVSLLLALQQEANGKHGTELQRSTIGTLASVFTAAPDEDSIPDVARALPTNNIATDSDRSAQESEVTKEATSIVAETPSDEVAAHPSARVPISPEGSAHLRSLLENAKNDSPHARTRLFEIAVQDALRVAYPDGQVITPSSGVDLGFDVGVVTPNGTVAIDLKYWQTPPSGVVVQRSLQRLSQTVRAAGFAGGVLITTAPPENRSPIHQAEVQALAPGNVTLFYWDGKNTDALVGALKRAGQLATG